MKKNHFFPLSLIALILLSGSGCSLLRARPAEDAGFLPKPELLTENRRRAPFHGYWVFDEHRYTSEKKRYTKIFIAPIDIERVRELYTAARGSEETKTHRIEEAEELAAYWRAKIHLLLGERLTDNPLRHSFSITEDPNEEALTLHLALVQVVPTNPGINLVGTAAGFFVPGGSLISFAGEGSVAMEGYVSRDFPEEALYEQFKDREGQKTSLFSLKDYQRYAHIRLVIDEWAEQIVALLTTPQSEMIDDGDLLLVDPL
ncbi:DUF3313 family protein [bacterium]|nr:DUF3313 family protein [bacterium]